MIFRRNPDPRAAPEKTRPEKTRPAFQVFLDIQKERDPPSAIVLQPDHSRVAGEIAKALHPGVFGALPPDVVRAIAEHDYGWSESDQQQIVNMHSQPLRPFPELSPDEATASWRESIRRAEAVSPLEGVVVSRHFCALSLHNPAHQPFAREENERRRAVEEQLGISSSDLDRYTGAIGFCDLASLYLCSGARAPAEFALGHPALPESRNAQKVVIEWRAGQPRFSRGLLARPATVFTTAFQRVAANELRPLQLNWILAR